RSTRPNHPTRRRHEHDDLPRLPGHGIHRGRTSTTERKRRRTHLVPALLRLRAGPKTRSRRRTRTTRAVVAGVYSLEAKRMIALRPYQEAALTAVYDHLASRDDNPCVVIPTGGGKGVLVGRLCADVVERWN